MKNLSIKMLCALFALLSANVAFAKGITGNVHTGSTNGVHAMTYLTSGVYVTNITGYTISDIHFSGIDVNSNPASTTPVSLNTNTSHQFDFDLAMESIQVSVTTTGSFEGPQYGIRIYDDLDNLIYDSLKQNSNFTYTFSIPEPSAEVEQVRIELYN